MDQQIEPSKPKLPSSTQEPKRAARLGWIIDQLAMGALAKGQTHTSERLRLNAEDLIDIPQEVLTVAFAKARRELDYVPQVSEIRRLALVDEKSTVDGEARAAWDQLIAYVQKYVGSGPEDGQCGPEYGMYGPSWKHEATYPKLPQRTLDCVRRAGSWIVLKRMTEENMPFIQKRFFEEYKAWEATEMAVAPLAKCLQLPEEKIKQLARPMDDTARRQNPPPNGAACTIKRPFQKISIVKTPPPIFLTTEQIAARRAEERAEIERYSKQG